MLTLHLGAIFLLAFAFLAGAQSRRYKPNWDDLDSRPLPPWYDEAKIGIFLHWGVFSVPSFRSEWFWEYWKLEKKQDVVDFMKGNYRPDFTYPDFAPQFTAEFFDPTYWAEIFQAAGARYVVLTTKHHEGFTLWPSKRSFNWNAMDVGPHRDLVGDLVGALRNKTDIHVGLYHSLYEWFNPIFDQERATKFVTQEYPRVKALPELYELVQNYRPDLIWSDGDPAPPEYWNSTQFLAWLFSDSPVKDTVVVNDRWGLGTACKHGSFFNCADRYNPGKKVNHKWENAMTIDRSSWGYRRNAVLSDLLSMEDILSSLASTVSCGGNLLLNVGPTKEGTIPLIFESRLRDMGSWLKVNGEAIYSSIPWQHQNDTVTKDIWYTAKKSQTSGYDVYAISLKWPAKNQLLLGAVIPNDDVKVTLLGYGPMTWKKTPSGQLMINVPDIPYDLMPCKWAWVFKVEGVNSF